MGLLVVVLVIATKTLGFAAGLAAVVAYGYAKSCIKPSAAVMAAAVIGIGIASVLHLAVRPLLDSVAQQPQQPQQAAPAKATFTYEEAMGLGLPAKSTPKTTFTYEEAFPAK